MSISLRIPGDPTAVRALGDWMSRMSSSLVEVDLELAYVCLLYTSPSPRD